MKEILVEDKMSRAADFMIRNKKIEMIIEAFGIDKEIAKNLSFEDWSYGLICVISKNEIESMENNPEIIHQYGSVSNNHYYFIKDKALGSN